jgi:hypothetical protein
LSNLEEIKAACIGNPEWTYFGSKKEDPFLSVFTDDIKDLLGKIEYEIGKEYPFADGEFNYKIKVTEEDKKPKFSFYIKSKKAITTKAVPTKKVFDISNYYLYIIIGFILLIFLVSINPILKAFFG